MLKPSIRRTLMAAALAAGCASANAGVLTFQGVTFTTTKIDNLLTLEIDAAHPTGDWARATTIGAFELKNVGSTGVQLLQAPGAAAGWTLSHDELTAKGCTGGAPGGSAACYSGAHVALADDMVFRFAFSGSGLDLDKLFMKVDFFVGDSKTKVGTIMSLAIPAGDTPPPLPPAPAPGEVPEPASLAILMGGLGLMGLVRRRRQK